MSSAMTITKFIKELNDILNVGWGDLPIYTYNYNDSSLTSDYILSEDMTISISDIIEIDEYLYIKDSSFDDWLYDYMDGNEECFAKYISKRHPELKKVAKKVLIDEFVDKEWEDNWDLIMPIIKHYYMTELEWENVVLIINH